MSMCDSPAFTIRDFTMYALGALLRKRLSSQCSYDDATTHLILDTQCSFGCKDYFLSIRHIS